MFNCTYGTGCNYSHEPLLKDFRCYQCGQKFSTHREMMVHRKKEHEVEDCRAFLKDGKCPYTDKCWWTHPCETEGFGEVPENPNPPNKKKPKPGNRHPCKKCGKIHKERRLNEDDDECNESADESPNGALDKIKISNWLPQNQYKRYKNRIKNRK